MGGGATVGQGRVSGRGQVGGHLLKGQQLFHCRGEPRVFWPFQLLGEADGPVEAPCNSIPSVGVGVGIERLTQGNGRPNILQAEPARPSFLKQLQFSVADQQTGNGSCSRYLEP